MPKKEVTATLTLTGLSISVMGKQKQIIIPKYAHDLLKSFEGQPLKVTISNLATALQEGD